MKKESYDKKRITVLNKSYARALEACKTYDVTLPIGREQWNGCSDNCGKAIYYDVVCNKCGHTYKTWFSAGKCGKCPYCDNRLIKSKATVGVRAYIYCEQHSLKPLFKQEDYISSHDKNNRWVKYPVECKVCHTKFQAVISKDIVTTCPTCFWGNRRSNKELIVAEMLKKLGIRFFRNYKHICFGDNHRPFELDLYLPDYSIAFEFNGYYWHQTGNGAADSIHLKNSRLDKDKYYHRNKTVACLQAGIKLYQLWDKMSVELLLSIIRAKVGKAEKIYARKCEVVEDAQASSTFLQMHHADGSCNFFKSFGLRYNDKLVAVIALTKRYKSGGVEIARYATEFNTEVVGGYSRLLKHAIEFLKKQDIHKLITYCNRDLTPDPMDCFYAKHGFTFLGDCGMIYKYYANKVVKLKGVLYKRGAVITRQHCVKQVLIQTCKDRGIEVLEDDTEFKLANKLKLAPVFNSGNFKFELAF